MRLPNKVINYHAFTSIVTNNDVWMDQTLIAVVSPVVWGLEFSRLSLCVSWESTNQRMWTVLYHRLIECWVFLHSVGSMSLDSWALGCISSGNILFHKRMSSFFEQNQRHPREVFLSCSHSRKHDLPVTQPLPSSTWLSVLFPFFLYCSSICFLIFFLPS